MSQHQYSSSIWPETSSSIVSNHAGSFAAESVLFEEFIINHLTNMLTNTTSYKLLEQIQLNDIYLIVDIEPWIIQ
jgi:hypothetical protein